MSREVVYVAPDITCQELVDEYVMKYRFDMFPVVRNELLVGIVQLDDVKDVPRDEWTRTLIEEVMEPVRDDLVLHPEDEAVECLQRMIRSGEQGRMPVVDDINDLVGIVTRRDILDLLKLKTDLGS